MKTFEEKWTAWLDGHLTGRELAEFEASLPDKAAAETERADAKKLSTLLKRELAAHALTNEEFFSHQVRERIAREGVAPVVDGNCVPRHLFDSCDFRDARQKSSRAITVSYADSKRPR